MPSFLATKCQLLRTIFENHSLYVISWLLVWFFGLLLVSLNWPLTTEYRNSRAYKYSSGIDLSTILLFFYISTMIPIMVIYTFTWVRSMKAQTSRDGCEGKLQEFTGAFWGISFFFLAAFFIIIATMQAQRYGVIGTSETMLTLEMFFVAFLFFETIAVMFFSTCLIIGRVDIIDVYMGSNTLPHSNSSSNSRFDKDDVQDDDDKDEGDDDDISYTPPKMKSEEKFPETRSEA